MYVSGSLWAPPTQTKTAVAQSMDCNIYHVGEPP